MTKASVVLVSSLVAIGCSGTTNDTLKGGRSDPATVAAECPVGDDCAASAELDPDVQGSATAATDTNVSNANGAPSAAPKQQGKGKPGKGRDRDDD